MQRNRKKTGRVLLHLTLGCACLVSIFPLIRVMTISLRPGEKIFSTEINLVPDEVTWRNFRDVFLTTDFHYWLLNSVMITSLTSLLGVSLAASAAYALSRFRFSLRTPVLVFLMATQMIPAVLLLLPIYFLLAKFKLLDSYTGVVIAYSTTTLPFNVWLLKGYFDTIPRSLEEAAQVDGLSQVRSFWQIVLPLASPALAIAVLFSVTQIWNEYIVARVVLQSSELYTWPLGIFELQGDFDARWGMFAAASVLVSLPVLAVFIYSAKWLLTGLTVGGVKG